MRPSDTRFFQLAAAVSFVASLALFWPGFAMYDSVTQYAQAVSGSYDDWHPPAMARLWAVLRDVVPGAGPMLALQLALYWLGLGGVAAALAATGRRKRAVAVLATGLLPPFLGWQAVVLKDTQATGALLAAAGLAAWWRLRGRRVPIAAGTAIVVLLGYATLVRANAVFAAVPLGIALLPGTWRWPARTGAAAVLTIAVLVLAPTINHRIFGATESGVERTAPLFDLAGIAARVPQTDDIGLSVAERRMIVDRHCARPFFWDPLGAEGHCAAIMDRVQTVPAATIDRLWITAILHHPFAYAAHRLAHLNSTDRWIVPRNWLSAAPSRTTEANALGLGTPGRAAIAWQRLGAVVVETPLGWPVAWTALAIVALAAALRRPPAPARDLAMALLVSALTLEASFGPLSIASDLRYHLWSMMAAALGTLLLADGRHRAGRGTGAGIAFILAVIGTGVVARMLLPPAGATYQAMLG